VVARHGCGRSPPTGGIEPSRDGHGISSQSNSRQGLLLYRRCASQREARSLCLRLRKPAARRPDSRRSSLAAAARTLPCRAWW
jgi:hypothetical protein